MKDTYQMITDRIIEKLEEGTIPWRKPWTGGSEGAPMNLVTKKPYRGLNVFMLACQEYDSPYWLTYKQAKAKGGHVKKGERGTPVIFWKQIAGKEKDEDGNEKTRSFPVLRHYTVFNVDQCENLDAPRPARDEEARTFDPIENCAAVVDEMPKPPALDHREQRAYYRPSTDTVNMPKPETFVNSESYYATLFHELTHSTGHDTRTGRHAKNNCDHNFGSYSYSKEELVAEFGAAFMCGHCGIENRTIDNAASYIDGWSRKLRNKPKMLIHAAAQAQKAVDCILSK